MSYRKKIRRSKGMIRIVGIAIPTMWILAGAAYYLFIHKKK